MNSAAIVRNCRACTAEFTTTHSRKVFCDQTCKSRWHDEHRDTALRSTQRRTRHATVRTVARPTRVGDTLQVGCLECLEPFTYEIGTGRGRRPQLCSDECRRSRRRRLEIVDKYGVTLEQYNETWERQGGRCGICKTQDLVRPGDMFAPVDHCHATGRFRGLLCVECNLALGQFHDDPGRLIQALRYLGVAFDGSLSWWHVDRQQAVS